MRGSFDAGYQVFWQNVTSQMLRCWSDAEYTTEQGAYGVAILLILDLTDYTIIERSYKGTRFDYSLGVAEQGGDLPFQKAARLEVSGIRSGDKSTVRTRVTQKLGRFSSSDDTSLPAYVVVVEFGSPLSQVVKK